MSKTKNIYRVKRDGSFYYPQYRTRLLRGFIDYWSYYSKTIFPESPMDESSEIVGFKSEKEAWDYIQKRKNKTEIEYFYKNLKDEKI